VFSDNVEGTTGGGAGSVLVDAAGAFVLCWTIACDCFFAVAGIGALVGTSASSYSGSSVIDVRAGSGLEFMRLFASLCFLVFLEGNVMGGFEGASQSVAVFGDQRIGRSDSFPGEIGNSNLFAALIVCENVG